MGADMGVEGVEKYLLTDSNCFLDKQSLKKEHKEPYQFLYPFVLKI